MKGIICIFTAAKNTSYQEALSFVHNSNVYILAWLFPTLRKSLAGVFFAKQEIGHAFFYLFNLQK